MLLRDEFFLQKALACAEAGRGFCAPNPAVGALLVKNNHIIASGYHAEAGKPHAEIIALDQAGAEARGASLYVTLEPCCHFGKTPPCTESIIHAGVSEVFYSVQDLNPLVAGKGIQILISAGIPCHLLPLPEIKNFYQSYQYWLDTQRPWVTAKIAMSLDGKIAGSQGERVQITGAELKKFTHQQRKRSDAILTTARTLNADNPELNVRLTEEIIKKPIYILERQLHLKKNLQIYQTAKSITVLRDLDLFAAMQHIGRDGIQDLWVEAGGSLFQALLEANLINKAFIYIAPITLGNQAVSAFDIDTANNLFSKMTHCEWHAYGRDVMAEIC